MAGSLFEAPRLEDGDESSSTSSTSSSSSSSSAYDFKKCMTIDSDKCTTCFESYPGDSSCGDVPSDITTVENCAYYNKDGCIRCQDGYAARTTSDGSSTDTSATDTSATDTSATDTSATDTSATDTSATDTSATDTTNTDTSNTTSTRILSTSSTDSSSSGNASYHAFPGSSDIVLECKKISDTDYVNVDSSTAHSNCIQGTFTAKKHTTTNSSGKEETVTDYTFGGCNECNESYYVFTNEDSSTDASVIADIGSCKSAEKIDNCARWSNSKACKACLPGYAMGGDGKSSSTSGSVSGSPSDSSSSSSPCVANSRQCQSFDGKKCTQCTGGDGYWAFKYSKDDGYTCSAQVLALAGLIVAGLNFF